MKAQGINKSTLELGKIAARIVDLHLLLGTLAYLSLINKMWVNDIKLGLPEKKLYVAMRKFSRIGGGTVEDRRNPWFQLIQFHGKKTVDRNLK